MVYSVDLLVFALFLMSVGFISLTGVLMPGPVFAAAVVKGAEDKHAGAWIALGHVLVEVPLIAAIAAGLYFVFTNYLVRVGIGLIGGSLLLYMGIRMFQIRNNEEVVKQAFPMHPVIAGLITTVTNPYFILWWVAVGASLIIFALGFGIAGILAFTVVHESCDLGWYYLVSYTTYRSKRFWTKKVHACVFGAFGILLAVFGVYFMLAFWV
jgi:threonine/homoserine/homoserine lactone efflux protein